MRPPADFMLFKTQFLTGWEQTFKDVKCWTCLTNHFECFFLSSFCILCQFYVSMVFFKIERRGGILVCLQQRNIKISFPAACFYASSSSVASLLIPAQEAAAKCSHLHNTEATFLLGDKYLAFLKKYILYFKQIYSD